MDKRSGIGLVLVTLVVFGWMYFMSTTQQNEPKKETKKIEKKASPATQAQNTLAPTAEAQTSDPNWKTNKYGAFFANFAEGNEERITIETDKYIARISNKGAAVLAWKIKDFKKWDGEQVQLIQNNKGELYMSLLTADFKKVDTRDMYFTRQGLDGKYSAKLTGKQELVLNYKLENANGQSIVKTLVFHGDKFSIEQTIAVNNMESVIPNRGYNLVWQNGVRYQEHNSVDESTDAMAIVQMNDTKEEFDASSDYPVDKTFTGIVDFAAIKTKYFTVGIIPQPWQKFDCTVDVNGMKNHYPENGVRERYGISFRIPYKGGVQKNTFQVYMGPLDYDIVKNYGMGKLVNFGWSIFRPIGEYLMLPLFRFIHNFVPNYGIAIIIFSFLIKILLHPLSISQMKTTQKMKLLGPEMQKIRDKFSDDKTKQQQETMKLYSEYGINPAGGCLPMVLQMPIMFSLWAVLRAAIELRQAHFFWWITDLSAPDVVINFGFSLMGLTHLSGLALLMGITMFIQQKMTVTDPNQKSMVYIMPIMFTFMFANFPSGLNLYYFCFNVLAIAQQVYMNYFAKNRYTLEDLRKMPKKEGWFSKKMKEAQDMAAAQGKTIPGANTARPKQGYINKESNPNLRKPKGGKKQ